MSTRSRVFPPIERLPKFHQLDSERPRAHYRRDTLDCDSCDSCDSYDSALVETVNGCYKTELGCGLPRPGSWESVQDLELTNLGWVHWHNTQRLHGYLGDIPPVEFEHASYAGQTTSTQLVGIE